MLPHACATDGDSLTTLGETIKWPVSRSGGPTISGPYGFAIARTPRHHGQWRLPEQRLETRR